MRVAIVENDPYRAEAIRGGLRVEAITADAAGDLTTRAAPWRPPTTAQ